MYDLLDFKVGRHMNNILVYSDSLSWGIIPGSRNRLEFNRRWPGVMEIALQETGLPVRVIEDCLNGRRTVWDDPFKPGRRGIDHLAQSVEINSPLALALVMLGTNDLQNMHNNNAWHAAQGVAALLETIRQAPIEPSMPTPKLLVVAPPLIEAVKGAMTNKFSGVELRCQGLPKFLQEVAEQNQCYFFDSNSVVTASKVDGVHLDAAEHSVLGKQLAQYVREILKE